MDLTVDHLAFRYRRREVFTDLSWAVPEGSRTLLLGPNGAGKSTLMKLCAGILRPRGGSVTLDGNPASHRQLQEAVALMPQHVTPVPRLTCREQVSYAGWLAGLDGPTSRQRSVSALESAGLADRSDVRATELSGGQLRRLGLAEALVRRTGLLFLDEPTAGLDPAHRARFRRTLAALPRETSIVVSTHETHDAGDLFDRVCILDEGRFRYDGSLEGLLAHTGTPTIEAAYESVLEHA